MGAEENRDLVTRAWSDLMGGDAERAFAVMSEDVVWTLYGSLAPVAGEKRGKDAVRQFFAGVGQAFPGGLRSEIRQAHATTSAVILEITNRGTTARGKLYENDYCFVFELEGGTIRAVREYVDLLKVKEAVFG